MGQPVIIFIVVVVFGDCCETEFKLRLSWKTIILYTNINFKLKIKLVSHEQ